jgi:hypothetical protein
LSPVWWSDIPNGGTWDQAEVKERSEESKKEHNLGRNKK